MRIGLYHGYELSGSGSNEYNRYLALALAKAGHEVHMICRETGDPFVEFTNLPGKIVIHRLPDASVSPVFVTDKQRKGNVKAFTDLTNKEIQEYHNLNEMCLDKILADNDLDVLHANHLVYQPIAALKPCKKHEVPLVIFPHGSCVEYTVRKDSRFRKLALDALLGADHIIVGNREMQGRLIELYPDKKKEILAKCKIVGVGVDTTVFTPIKRAERVVSLQKLLAAERNLKGKTFRQTIELQERLTRGELMAVRDYWEAYQHSSPDAELPMKLNQIDWNGNILLFVGALTVGKGLQSLITSLPFVLESNPQTHLVIIGAGAYREVLEGLVYAISSGDLCLLRELVMTGKDLDRNDLTGPWEDVAAFLNEPEKIQQLFKLGQNLQHHVHFLGRLDHNLLKFIFPCSDIAIFPSVIPEAYPLVLMESLSAGVFPLVSYFSGFKDGVDELNQFLPEEWVDTMKIPVDPLIRIETLISHINKALSLVPSGIKEALPPIARKNYDWTLRANQLVEAYQNQQTPESVHFW